MHLPNGHLLQHGKYKLTNKVGQGGFGITYKGVWFTEVQGSLGKVKTEVPICIKEYFFKDYCLRDTHSAAVKVHSETGKILFQKFKEKLIREARILSHVHHPYIVNVLEVFEENDTAYIAMEYISGSSLKEKLEQEHVLSEDVVLHYIRQIGEALQFVHEKNVLHLDIKPSNILIDKHNHARLIDFGVSKRYDIESQETSTTMLTLSKGFASIEQYDDEGTLHFSPWPDIYSLGATMYNLLTGKIPVESILRATKELPEPKAINPEISEKTNAAIMKAMQIVPADRFQTVEEMLAALDLPVLPLEQEVEEDTGIPTEGGDTTLLYGMTNQPSVIDGGDETILHQPVSMNEASTKRRKRTLMFLLSLVALALTATAVLLINKPETPAEIEDVTLLPVVMTSVSPDPKDTSHSTEMDNKQTLHQATDQIPEAKTQQSNTKPASAESRDLPVQQMAIPTPVDNQPTPSEAEKDAAYQALLTSGKSKMEKADYVSAMADLKEAGEIKMTEEVVRLKIAVDALIAEQQIAERKALYEEKMAFGSYMIVRNKATSKYGAIDKDGNEVINCKYQSVGRSENGRAFMREDNLFDIYNANGQLIKKGVANY